MHAICEGGDSFRGIISLKPVFIRQPTNVVGYGHSAGLPVSATNPTPYLLDGGRNGAT